MAIKIWRNLPGTILLFILNMFAAVALIFEGYNQGVQGNATGTAGFIQMAQIGFGTTVTDSTKQGGLVSAYYFGCLFGAFGGKVGDKFGRRRGVLLGSLLCIVGGSLQAASQNTNMFICARVLTGIGIGFINSTIPPWVSELAKAHNRGANFATVFVANYVGITLAYWLGYGVRNEGFEFNWRFPLAFMTVPVLIIVLTVAFIPDSPRWLIANNRRDEALEVLAKVRGDVPFDDPELKDEVEQLEAVIEASEHKRNHLHNLVLGRYSGRLHLGRRVWLSLGLQQIELWTGIMAITSYSGKLMSQAGFDSGKAAWLSGLCNTFGIVGTIAAIPVIDRMGRIWSLITGLIIQGIVLFLSAAFTRVSELSTDPARADAFGTAAASMVFVFLFAFCMFTIIPSWIWSTEIYPQEIRAKAFGFTIFGWAMGCGVTTLVIPIMLSRLGWATFLVFGCFNIVALPIVYYLYPETSGRSLEEVNLLFASPSLLVSKNMEEYHRLINEAGGNVAVAERRLLDSVDAEYSETDARALAVSEEGKVNAHTEFHEKVPSESDNGSK